MNHSSYPRVGDSVKLQALRRVYDQWERGTKTLEEVRAAEDLAALEAIMDQDRVGVDVVTDGQVRWIDPISHQLKDRSGVRITSLIRYFDTNFYIRQPEVLGKELKGTPAVREEYVYARSLTQTPVKAVLTGPLTLACHAIWHPPLFESVEQVAEAMAGPVAADVRALAEAGAPYIQIDEPSLAQYDMDVRKYKNILKPVMSAKGNAKLILSVFFGNCTPLLGPLSELEVDLLCLDFTYSPDLPQELRESGMKKPLVAGWVDGRTTRLENPRDLARELDRTLGRVRADTCYVAPSCGLEYLPRERAQKKLELLARVRSHLQGGTA